MIWRDVIHYRQLGFYWMITIAGFAANRRLLKAIPNIVSVTSEIMPRDCEKSENRWAVCMTGAEIERHKIPRNWAASYGNSSNTAGVVYFDAAVCMEY